MIIHTTIIANIVQTITTSANVNAFFLAGLLDLHNIMLSKIVNPVENGVLEIDPEKAVKVEKSGYAEVDHVGSCALGGEGISADIAGESGSGETGSTVRIISSESQIVRSVA